MRNNTIQAVTRDSCNDLKSALMLMALVIKARRPTAKAPILPASVGVKKPSSKPPMITIKIMSTPTIPLRDTILSFQEDLFPLGPREGLILHHNIDNRKEEESNKNARD